MSLFTCLYHFISSLLASSNLMSFCCYELAKNPLIQEKLRKDIHEVLKKNDMKISYEAIKDMNYLHMVLEGL